MIGLSQVLTVGVRVDLGIMEMKGYISFPKSSGLEPAHQMQFSDIPKTLIGRWGS